MNCTKCGKEIEEGKTICDECQKTEEKKYEELDELFPPDENEKEAEKETVKEEIKEEVKEESKKDSKEEKKKAKKEKKENKKSKKQEETKSEDNEKFKVAKEKKNNAFEKIIAIVIIIALVIVAGLLIFSIFNGNKKVGNEIGNIRNYGYATKKGNTIYYLAPNELSTKVGIFSVDSNGENKKEIFMNDKDILSLNVYGNYLYFITTVVIDPENPDEYDNQICRVKTDGKDFEIINDNEFNDYCYEIYAVNNKIYYIGEDSNIYKMNLDGSNRELVSDNETGYIGITDKYIIYNEEIDENAEIPSYQTCIMNLDGTEKRVILENTRLYTVNVINDVIYYTDKDLRIYKVNLDGTENELVFETEAYNLNVTEDYIYYLNYADIENEDKTICINRVNLDGTDHQIIKKLYSGTSFVNIVGDWALYMDSTLEAGYIKIVKIDGSEEKDLYVMDFKKLYEQYTDTSIVEEDLPAEETNTTENSNVNETVNTIAESKNTVVNVVDDDIESKTVSNTAEVENTLKINSEKPATNETTASNVISNEVPSTTNTAKK